MSTPKRFAHAAATLLALVLFAPFSIQASAYTPGPLVQVSDTSPFADCTADSGQSGTNYLNSEVEPWVSASPANPQNIAGSWQQDRWSDGGARGLVAGVSQDGGQTWQEVVIPGLTLCSGGTYQRASDPWLSFAPNGDLYHISLVFNSNDPRNGVVVNKSTDGGLSWSAPVTLIEDTDPTVFNDKESLTADPNDASYVYAVWDRLDGLTPGGGIPERLIGNRGPTYFSRTTDGGQTWEPARPIYDPGRNDQTIGNQIVVLPSGTVLNFFAEYRTARLWPRLAFIRSTDHGATWFPDRYAPRVASMRAVPVRDPETGDPVRTGGGLLDVAVDAQSGALYAVWEDARFSGYAYNSIALAMSTDGGNTWSAPIKINQTPTDIPPGNQQAFTPAVHVAADGTVGVTYYDFRNNDGGPDLKTDYFAAHCHPTTMDACADPANWDVEQRLTDAPFDMRQAPVAGGFFVGDYEGLDAVGDDFGAFFSQTEADDPASVFFRRFGPGS